MIRTFDFLFLARRDQTFFKQIMECIDGGEQTSLATETHRLVFEPKPQTVLIEPLSASAPYAGKIIPARISYCALMHMLKEEWDSLREEEIVFYYDEKKQHD